MAIEPKRLTERQKRTLALLKRPENFIQGCLSIVDQQSIQVPYILNDVQKDYLKNRSRRDIIVKARKMGFSALITAVWLHACAFEKNTKAVVISHEEEATKRLLRRVHDYIKTSKFPINIKGTGSAYEIHFPDTNSYFYIGTAGSKAFGRGDDITHLHFSESSSYQNWDAVTSATEAVIKGGGWVVMESTAKGAGTKFHELWVRAIRGEGEWKPHFYGWFRDRLNRRVGAQPFELTDEERKLRTAFNLDWEQIAWRRWKIGEMQEPELFPQEHPATWDEAFLSSGRMLFDWEAVKRHEDSAQKAKWVGALVDTGSSIHIEPNPKGPFFQYDTPKNGHRYLLSCDSADGVPGGAYSVADVWDMRSWEQVAQFRGHLDPASFGQMLARIGAHYNWALVAVENNTPGNAVLVKLVDLGYPNIYDEPGEPGDRLGWQTTEKTKGEFVSDGRACIKDGSIKINSPATIAELRTFVLDDRGKMTCQSGCFQDCVITMCKGANILMRHAVAEPEQRRGSFREIMARQGLGPTSSGGFKPGKVV